MKASNLIKLGTFLSLMACLTTLVMAQDVVHIVSGVVTKVDKEAKMLSVKTADGTDRVFKYSDQTAVHSAEAAASAAKVGAVDSYFAGKEGTHVVVRYTEKGTNLVARSVSDLGKDTVKTSQGVITKVDKQAHTLRIKTNDGAEETYSFGKDAASDSDKGMVHGWDYTETKAKEGDKVTVEYTERAGKKFVHFFRGL